MLKKVQQKTQFKLFSLSDFTNCTSPKKDRVFLFYIDPLLFLVIPRFLNSWEDKHFLYHIKKLIQQKKHQ